MPHEALSHHAHLVLEPLARLLPTAVVSRSIGHLPDIRIATSESLRPRWSLAQQQRPWVMTTRLRRFATVALWPFALSLTFAGFDWVMGLSPGWGSTAFGLYMFATGMLGGLALLVLLVYLAERGGPREATSTARTITPSAGCSSRSRSSGRTSRSHNI